MNVFKKIRVIIIDFYNKEPKPIIKKILYLVRYLGWVNIILAPLCIVIAYILFGNLVIENTSVLSRLLTINGIFSAVLITYLFTRVTWTKDRKLEIYKNSVNLSGKITEFRRIVNKIVEYYNVWENDNSTKRLLDQGKFKNIDFYDYWTSNKSGYSKINYSLVKELKKDKDFDEGLSALYLAMISIVKDRNIKEWYWQRELFKDFKFEGVYQLNTVEKWINCQIFGTIQFWLQRESDQIDYSKLNREKEYIMSAAARFNSKYGNYELGNELIKEMAEDINEHYLRELYENLVILKKGIQNMDIMILTLVLCSLFFGVLFPFLLLLINTSFSWYEIVVRLVVTINSMLITFFILKFPFLINKEFKWIK